MSDDEQFVVEQTPSRFTHLRFYERVAQLDLDASYRAEVSTPGFMAVLSKDNKAHLAPVLPTVVKSLVSKISDSSAELYMLEQNFMNLAFIFRFFSVNLGEKIEKFGKILLPLLCNRQEHIRSFAGEAVAYIFKRLPISDLISTLDRFAKSLLVEDEEESSDAAMIADGLSSVISALLVSVDDTFSNVRTPLVVRWALSKPLVSHTVLSSGIFGAFVRMRLHTTEVHGKGSAQLLQILFDALDSTVKNATAHWSAKQATPAASEPSTAASKLDGKKKKVLLSQAEASKEDPNAYEGAAEDETRLAFILDLVTMWAVRLPRLHGDFDGFTARFLRAAVAILDTNAALPLGKGASMTVIRSVIRAVAAISRALPASVERVQQLSKDKPEELLALLEFPASILGAKADHFISNPQDWSIGARVSRVAHRCPSCCSTSKPSEEFEDLEESQCACALGLGAVSVLMRPFKVPSLTEEDLASFAELAVVVLTRQLNYAKARKDKPLPAAIATLTTAAASVLAQVFAEQGPDMWLSLPQMVLRELQVAQTAAGKAADAPKPAAGGRAALQALLSQQTQQKTQKAKAADKPVETVATVNDRALSLASTLTSIITLILDASISSESDAPFVNWVAQSGADIDLVVAEMAELVTKEQLSIGMGMTAAFKNGMLNPFCSVGMEDPFAKPMAAKRGHSHVDSSVAKAVETAQKNAKHLGSTKGAVVFSCLNALSQLASGVRDNALLGGEMKKVAFRVINDINTYLNQLFKTVIYYSTNANNNSISNSSSSKGSKKALPQIPSSNEAPSEVAQISPASQELLRSLGSLITPALHGHAATFDEIFVSAAGLIDKIATTLKFAGDFESGSEAATRLLKAARAHWILLPGSPARLQALVEATALCTGLFDVKLTQELDNPEETIAALLGAMSSREASVRLQAGKMIQMVTDALTAEGLEAFVDVDPLRASDAATPVAGDRATLVESVARSFIVRVGPAGPKPEMEGIGMVDGKATTETVTRDLRRELFDFLIAIEGTANALDSERLKTSYMARIGRNVISRLDLLRAYNDKQIEESKSTRPAVKIVGQVGPACSETEVPVEVAASLLTLSGQLNEKFSPLWRTALEVIGVLVLPNGQAPPEPLLNGSKKAANSGRLATKAKGTKSKVKSAADTAALGSGLNHAGVERVLLLSSIRLVEFATVRLSQEDQLYALNVPQLLAKAASIRGVELEGEDETDLLMNAMDEEVDAGLRVLGKRALPTVNGAATATRHGQNQTRVTSADRTRRTKKVTRRSTIVGERDLEEATAWLARTGGVVDPASNHAALFESGWSERMKSRAADCVDPMTTHHEACNVWQMLVVAWNKRLGAMKELKNYMAEDDATSTVTVQADPVLQWGLGEAIGWALGTAEVAANPHAPVVARPAFTHRNALATLNDLNTSTLAAGSRAVLMMRLCDLVGVLAAVMSTKRASLGLEIVSQPGRGLKALTATNRLTELCSSVLVQFASGALQRTVLKFLGVSRIGARVSRFSDILENITIDAPALRDTLNSFTLAVQEEDEAMESSSSSGSEGEEEKAAVGNNTAALQLRKFIMPEERPFILPIILKMLLARLAFNNSSAAGIANTQRAAVFECLNKIPTDELPLLMAVVVGSCLSVAQQDDANQFLGPYDAERKLVTIIQAAEERTRLQVEDRNNHPLATEEERDARVLAKLGYLSETTWTLEESGERFIWGTEGTATRLLFVSPTAQQIRSGEKPVSAVAREARLLSVLHTVHQILRNFETRLYGSGAFLMQLLVSVLVEAEALLGACNEKKNLGNQQDDEEEDDEEAAANSTDFNSKGREGTTLRSIIRMSLQRITELLQRFPEHPAWPAALKPAESTMSRLLLNTVQSGALTASALLMQQIASTPATFPIFDSVWPGALEIFFTAGQSGNVLRRAEDGMPSEGLVECALDVALKLMRGGEGASAEARKVVRASEAEIFTSKKAKDRARKRREEENSSDEEAASDLDEQLQAIANKATREEDEQRIADRIVSEALAQVSNEVPHRDVLVKDWKRISSPKEAAEIIAAQRAAGLAILRPRLNALLQSMQVLIPVRKGMAGVTSINAQATLQGRKMGQLAATIAQNGRRTARQQATMKLNANTAAGNNNRDKTFVTMPELELFAGAVSLATDNETVARLARLLVASLPPPGAAAKLRQEHAIRRVRLTMESLKNVTGPLAAGLATEVSEDVISYAQIDNKRLAAVTSGLNSISRAETEEKEEADASSSHGALFMVRDALRKLLVALNDYPSRELLCETLLATEASLNGVKRPLGYLAEFKRTSHAEVWRAIAEKKNDSALALFLNAEARADGQKSSAVVSALEKRDPIALWSLAEAHMMVAMNVIKPSLNYEPDVDIHADVLANLADLHIAAPTAGSVELRVVIDGDGQAAQSALLLPAAQIEVVTRQLVFLISADECDMAVRRAAVVCLASIFRRFTSTLDELDAKVRAAPAEKRVSVLTEGEILEFTILQRVIFSVIALTLRRGLQTASEEAFRAVLQSYSTLIRLLSVENRLVKAFAIGRLASNHTKDASFFDDAALADEEKLNELLDGVVVLSDLVHADLYPLLRESAVGNGASVDAVGDVGGDLFGELLHLQRHRRARALHILAKAAQEGTLRPVTAGRFGLPIAVWGLLQKNATKESYDVSLGERSIEALAACTASANWKIAVGTARHLATLIKKWPVRERQLVRAICAVISAYDSHLKDCADAVTVAEQEAKAFAGAENTTINAGDSADVIAQKQEKVALAIQRAVRLAQREEATIREAELEDAVVDIDMDADEFEDEEVEMVDGVEIALGRKLKANAVGVLPSARKSGERVKAVSAEDALAKLSAMQRALTSRVMPVLRSLILDKSKAASTNVTAEGKGAQGAEENGTIRPAVVAVMLRILRCLPPKRFHIELPRLVNKLIAGLKSRDINQREAARRALVDASVALGPAYLPWMISEMAGHLKRGFLQAVLVYTVHAMLQAVSDAGSQKEKNRLMKEKLAALNTAGTDAQATSAKKKKKKIRSLADIEAAEEARDRQAVQIALEQQRRARPEISMSAGCMDAAVPHVMPLIVQELERQLDADRPDSEFTEIGSAKKGVKEAKAVKGPAIMRLVAQWCSPGACMTSVLVFLYGLLMGTAYDRDAGGTRQVSKAFSAKYLNRVRDITDSTVLGFGANRGLDAEGAFRLSMRMTTLAAHLMKKSTTAARHRAARRARFEAAGGRFGTGSFWVTRKESLTQTGAKGADGKSLEQLEEQEMQFLNVIDDQIAVNIDDGPNVTDGALQQDAHAKKVASTLPVHLGGDQSSVPKARIVHQYVNADRKQEVQVKEADEQKARESKLANHGRVGPDGKPLPEGTNVIENQRQVAHGVKGVKTVDDRPDLGNDEETIKAAIRLADQRYMLQAGAANGRRVEVGIKNKASFDPATRATAIGVAGLKMLLLSIRNFRLDVAKAVGLTTEGMQTAFGDEVRKEARRVKQEEEDRKNKIEEIDSDASSSSSGSSSSDSSSDSSFDESDVDMDTAAPQAQLADQKAEETARAVHNILETIIGPLVSCFTSSDPELLGAAARVILQLLPLNLASVDASAKDIALTVLKVFETAGAHSGNASSFHGKLNSQPAPEMEVVPTCTRLLAALLSRQSKDNRSCSAWFTTLLSTGEDKEDEVDIPEGEDGALLRWKKRRQEELKKQLPDQAQQARLAAMAFTQAVVAQVRTSLDDAKLAPSAITLFQKVILAQQKRGDLEENVEVRGAVYECADRLGEVLITSKNPRVGDLAGRAYVDFVLTFPMAPKVQTMRVHHLLKNLAYSVENGRVACMNAIHRFVKACPRQVLIENYASLIVLSVGARLGAETQIRARKFASVLLSETLKTVQIAAEAITPNGGGAQQINQLFNLSYSWVDADKPSMRAGFSAMAEAFVQAWGVDATLANEARLAKLLTAVLKVVRGATVPEPMISGQLLGLKEFTSAQLEGDELQLEGRRLPLAGDDLDDALGGGEFRAAYAALCLLEKILSHLDAPRMDAYLAKAKGTEGEAALRKLWAFLLSHGVSSDHPWIRSCSMRVLQKQLTSAAEHPALKSLLLQTPLLSRGVPTIGGAPMRALLPDERKASLSKVVAFACRSVAGEEVEMHQDTAMQLRQMMVALARVAVSVPGLEAAFEFSRKEKDEIIDEEAPQPDEEEETNATAAEEDADDESAESDVDMSSESEDETSSCIEEASTKDNNTAGSSGDEGFESAIENASSDDEESGIPSDASFMSESELPEALKRRLQAEEDGELSDASDASSFGIPLFVDEDGSAIAIDRSDDEEDKPKAGSSDAEEEAAAEKEQKDLTKALKVNERNAEKAVDEAIEAAAAREIDEDEDRLEIRLQKEEQELNVPRRVLSAWAGAPGAGNATKRKLASAEAAAGGRITLPAGIDEGLIEAAGLVGCGTVLFMVRKLELHVKLMMRDVKANAVRLAVCLDVMTDLVAALPLQLLVSATANSSTTAQARILECVVAAGFRASSLRLHERHVAPNMENGYWELKVAGSAAKLAAVHDKGQQLLETLEARLVNEDRGNEYTRVLTAVRSRIAGNRLRRKVATRREMVANPEAALARRKRDNERKVVARKNKKHEAIAAKKGLAASGMRVNFK